MRSTVRTPKLREACFSDHEQIARLESRFGLAPKSYEERTHLWLGNPLYKDLQGEWTIGWVLEDENRRIVATMANIPLLYEFEGKTLIVASGSNWVAEPSCRSASLLLLDHVINQSDVDLYLNNTVSAASAAAVTALGCSRVPVGQWDKSAIWTTDYQSVFERRLARRKIVFAKPLSRAIAAGIRLKDRLVTKALRKGDVEVSHCTRFDDRFDDFWETLRQRHPHLLLAVRTRDVLEWHYKYALLNDKLWIAIVVDGPRLAAYATFQRMDRPVWGKRVRLVDYQSLDGSTALLTPLLSWALAKCRDERIHTLEIVGRWLENGELGEPVTPSVRELPTWKFVYRATTAALAASLRNPRAWAPSLFDGDASL